MTIAQALDVRHRSVSYREAEVLLAEITGLQREYLLAHPDQNLDVNEVARYEDFLIRRERNEPVAYIIGYKEFYGRPFRTDSRALIPRPETEGMIDLAVAFLSKRFKGLLAAKGKPCPLSILELGTGSGNITITLAHELATKRVAAEIVATDIAPEALELAEVNAVALGVPSVCRITWVEADLFGSSKVDRRAPYDLILANLPYVATTWKQDPAAQQDVLFYEPDVALFGGVTGTDIYQRFWLDLPTYLKPDGDVLIEFDHGQSAEMLPFAQAALPTHTFNVIKDYAGLDRLLQGRPKKI